jgi:hypothetical protein
MVDTNTPIRTCVATIRTAEDKHCQQQLSGFRSAIADANYKVIHCATTIIHAQTTLNAISYSKMYLPFAVELTTLK